MKIKKAILKHQQARGAALWAAALLIAGACCLPAAAEEEQQVGSLNIVEEELARHLVIINLKINGEARKGHGVIVQMDGQPYILTNQHLLLGAEGLRFTTAKGDPLKPVKIELSRSRDLIRLALGPEAPEGLPVSSKAAMNSDIAVFSSGDGTLFRTEYGNIIGVGSGSIEISAEFDDTNNGAPVLMAGNKVVGITTRTRESSFSVFKSGSRFQKSIRYFCSRAGTEDWIPVKWRSYNSSTGKAYREHEEFYALLTATLENWTGKESADKAETLAKECRLQARHIRKALKKQRLTEFLQEDFENKAMTFEHLDNELSEYARLRR